MDSNIHMKKTGHKVFAAMALLLIAVACKSNRGIIERPFIESANTLSLSFDRVEWNDSSTVLNGVLHHELGNRVMLSSKSEIRVDTARYPVVSIKGIVPDEQIIMPDSGVVRFSMVFPVIPKNTKRIDFTETTPGGVQIWGIELSGKYDHRLHQRSLPPEVRKQRNMPDTVFAYGDTTVIKSIFSVIGPRWAIR